MSVASPRVAVALLVTKPRLHVMSYGSCGRWEEGGARNIHNQVAENDNIVCFPAHILMLRFYLSTSCAPGVFVLIFFGEGIVILCFLRPLDSGVKKKNRPGFVLRQRCCFCFF